MYSKMKLIKILFAILFLVNLSLADVIYFANGDIDEGHVNVEDDMLIIAKKDKTGKYGVPTNSIKRVEYGIWKEDLDPTLRKVVESTKKVKPISVKGTQHTINRVTHALPKNVPMTSYELNQSTKVQTIIFISVFILLSIISFVCTIVLLVDAFKCSIAWGLCSLFIPIVIWIYLFTNYSGSKGKMFLWLMAPIMWAILALSVIMLTS